MITFEQFQKEVPQEPTRENYDAFVRMSRAFRADHCTSSKAAEQIILDSMDLISNDLYESEDTVAYRDVFKRYADLDELYK